MSKLLCLLVLGWFVAVAAGAQRGGDWPCWLGPNQNYVSDDTGLIDRFPREGPRVVWQAKVLPGYAGVSVVGDRLYTVSCSGEEVVTKDYADSAGQINRKWGGAAPVKITVYCLSTADGKELWKHEYETAGKFPVTDWEKKQLVDGPWGNYFGPKATPTVEGDRVYTYDFAGVLHCLGAADGKVIWKKDVRKEFAGTPPRFGYAAPPLMAGKLVVVPLFADDGCLAAMNKDSGELVWRGGRTGVLGKDAARWDGYSIPVLRTLGGRPQIIYYSGGGVQAVDPENGKQLWEYPMKHSTGETVPPPLTDGKRVVVTSYYTALAQCIGFEEGKPEALWKSKEIKPRFANATLYQGNIYGSNGSHRGATFRCVDLETGQLKWSTEFRPSDQAESEHTQVVVADGRLYLMTGFGALIIAEATAEGYKELSRGMLPAAQPDAEWWVPQAIARGRMYCRSTLGHVVCVDLAAQPKP